MGLKKLKGLFCGKLLVSLILGVTLGMGNFCLNRAIVHAEEINTLLCPDNLDSETDTFKIPDGITKIEGKDSAGSVDGKKYVKKIIIPSSVTEIGEYAFLDFTELEEIIIPSSVTKIGNAAFWCCSALKEIIIPSSVTEIAYEAFGIFR